MKEGIKYITALLMIMLTSCELNKNLDIELPEGEPVTVIEAYLVDGEPYQLLLFNSNTLTEPVRINLIWNARAYIIQGDDSLKLRNITKFDPETFFMYNYLHDSLVSKDVPGYKLYIEVPDALPVTAVSRPVGDVKIEDIDYSDGNIVITTRNSDDPLNNYYLLRMYEYKTGITKDIHQLEVDMHDEPSGPVNITYPLSFVESDSVHFDLYRIDSAAYSYQRSISNALGANRDPFTTPSPFMGNLQNAWGIFTCVSRDGRTEIFNND